MDVSPNYGESLKTFVDSVKLTRQIVHDNLIRRQALAKQYYDRTYIYIDLGDLVWQFNSITSLGFSWKFQPRYIGPYLISQIGPNHTYKLRHYRTNIPTDTFINA